MKRYACIVYRSIVLVVDILILSFLSMYIQLFYIIQIESWSINR